MPGDWRATEVWNETVFREMNEWSNEDNGGKPDNVATYLCECSDTSCSEPILMMRSEYERVRAFAARFVIALDHENPEIDYLVHEAVGFAVIETLGTPARIARVTDPRRTHGRTDR